MKEGKDSSILIATIKVGKENAKLWGKYKNTPQNCLIGVTKY